MAQYGRITNDMIANKLEYFNNLAAQHNLTSATLVNPFGRWYHLMRGKRTLTQGTKAEVYAWLVGACDAYRDIEK